MPANSSDPATKQDLQDLQDGLQHQMQNLEDRLGKRMKEQGDHLVEQMRDMQTEVLRAFHDWAPTMETRLRVLPLLDERLTILEDRVSRIERGDRPAH